MKTHTKTLLTAAALAASLTLTGTADAAVIGVTDSIAAASARTAKLNNPQSKIKNQKC